MKKRIYEIDKSIETIQAIQNYIGKTFNSLHYGKFKVLGCYDKYTSKSGK